MCIHFVHECALLVSPGTTCDLRKGKVGVLMWQLMPFPPLQMASIGHRDSCWVSRQQRGRGGKTEGVEGVRRQERVFWDEYMFVRALCAQTNANCLLTSSSVSYRRT